ncbi:MAG TPA: hypothetical protein VFR47_24395 [Anaerolineales bacterium]|nr:hypothetical protein [Anaerolineales bacterium]
MHFSNSAGQPAEAVNAIRFMIGPLSSMILLDGIAFALFYPLSPAAREKIMTRRATD